MSPADGIATLLINGGLVTTGWTLLVSELTPDPDQQIVTLDGGGRMPEVLINQDYPTAQVLVRGGKGANGYTAAYAKAKAIFTFLQAFPCPDAAPPSPSRR